MLPRLRRVVANLANSDADAKFAKLKEGCAIFKLDPESLKYLVLQPNGPLATLDKSELQAVLLRRSDAWNYRGRKAAWVEEIIASLELTS